MTPSADIELHYMLTIFGALLQSGGAKSRCALPLLALHVGPTLVQFCKTLRLHKSSATGRALSDRPDQHKKYGRPSFPPSIEVVGPGLSCARQRHGAVCSFNGKPIRSQDSTTQNGIPNHGSPTKRPQGNNKYVSTYYWALA